MEPTILVLTTPCGLVFCGSRDLIFALAAALPRAHVRPLAPVEASQ